MADVSQVKINNVTYNIKDTTARTTANGKVSKSGDTMTGNLYVETANIPSFLTKNTNVEVGTTVPPTDIWTGGIGMQDKNNNNIGLVATQIQTDGSSNIRMLARSKNGGTNIDNSVLLSSAPDGTRTVYVSHPALWRSAIGAVNIAGDTMSGNLAIAKTDATQAGLTLKRTDITTGTRPSSNTYIGTIWATDVASHPFSGLETMYFADGRTRLRLFARQYVSGTITEHSLSLYMKDDGTKQVGLEAEPWLSALSAGVETGTATLNTTNCASGTITYRKWGPIVSIYVSSAVKLNSNLTAANIVLGTIPSGYRPLANAPYLGGHDAYPSTVWINTNGNITFCRPSTIATWETTRNIYFSATYFVA